MTVRGTLYDQAVVLWELDDLDCKQNPELPCDQYVPPEPSVKYEEWGLTLPTAEELFQDPGKIAAKVLAIFGRGEGLIAGGEHHLTEGGEPKLQLDVVWELASVSCDGPRFSVVDTPGSMSINAWGIGQDNVVVGSARKWDAADGRWEVTGFFSEDETLSDFAFPGACNTWPTDINSRMEIAGYYQETASGTRQGFVLKGGDFTSISYEGDETIDTTIWGSNDRGDLVGFSAKEGGFIWRNGKTVPVMRPGADFARPGDVNNQNDIVGHLRDAAGDHGFLLRGGIFEIIDNPVLLRPLPVESTISGISSAAILIVRGCSMVFCAAQVSSAPLVPPVRSGLLPTRSTTRASLWGPSWTRPPFCTVTSCSLRMCPTRIGMV